MKKIYLILMGLFIQNISAQTETTIYLIRHSEKADSSSNTELSAEGKKGQRIGQIISRQNQ